MSKHLLTIDPIALLTEKQLEILAKNEKSLTTTGTLGDTIEDMLESNFEFSNVFQSTDETHVINMHDFLMKEKTNQRGMHNMGELETPTGLVAYVAVDDEWLNKHKLEASKGVAIELDDRVDIKQLHASDGATKDGKTTGFIRYGKYKTPVMAMLPNGPLDEQETVEAMEREADRREKSMRGRASKISAIHAAYKNAKHGSLVDAFMAGWNLKETLQGERDPEPEILDTPKAELEEPDTTLNVNKFSNSLEELSIQQMINDQQQR